MVYIDIFNLFAKLSLDKSDYEKGIDDAKKKGEEFAEHTDKKVKAKSIIAWTAIATAVVALTKKIYDLARTTADYADQVGDLAEKWGFTTKQIQEFDYWATQNGTTLEALLTGMRGLVNNAQAGSEAFKKLGVEVNDANGNLKDQKTLFMETITALQKVENQTERNALQFDIFGRSGVELGQVINRTGAELEALSQKAQDYGLIISDEAIKKSSDFNDELDTLKKQFRSLIAEMIAGTPEADKKFEEFTKNLETNFKRYLPQFTRFLVSITGMVIVEIIRQLPVLIQSLFDAILDLDWFKLGIDIGWSIVKGILNTIWEGLQTIVGKGWLWGGNDTVGIDNTTTQQAISTVTSSNISERTTRVDEKLEITLNVESDGTVASEKNLDIVSDLLKDKINKALGDMING